MRLKARVQLNYAGKDFGPGALFDAFGSYAHALLDQGKAEPFGLEDPSQRTWSDIIEPYLPEEPTAPAIPDVPPVTITPTSSAPTAAGESASFQVTITGGGASGTWTVDKDGEAAWLTVISPTAPQTANGLVDYTVDINDGPERTGHMYVNGKTFTVVQAAAA